MSPRPARKPVHIYHHGDLRDALVQAALAEAEAGGPEAISISALAKKLGVSQPAPYKHFADRESLLTAVTAVALRKFIETVREAIATLPVDFREVVVLRELEGLSYKEISEVSGVPLGTVMSRLARARHQLYLILSDRKQHDQL